jgi:GTPase SAR1 family protein
MMTGLRTAARDWWRRRLIPLTNRRTLHCPFCFGTFKLKAGIKDKKIICPRCTGELPANVIDYRDGIRPVTIAVIGAKEAGKSHFIAVLIEWIKQSGSDFSWNIRGTGDETIDRYREDFYERVFDDKRTIDATRSAKAHVGTKRPLSFILTLNRGRRASRIMLLNFYDTAGEDLDEQDVMSQVNKYIYKSNGIILLMDPLQLAPVREALGKSIELPSRNAEVEDIVQRTANLVRNATEISESDEIRIPLAAAFTKIDAVLPVLPADTALQQPSGHLGTFSQADFDDVDGEMRALLRDWGGKSLLSQIDTNFHKKAYFGISALGCNPGVSQRIPAVKPIRVLDPLIWHLYLQGFIDKAR